MKPKLLTKRQQIGIFNCADPIAVMREYVSFSDEVIDVALARLLTASLDDFIQHLKDKDDEKEFTRRYMAEKPDMFIEVYIRKCKAEKAEEYLDTFFKGTSLGRCEYRDDEKKEYYDRLYAKQEDDN